MTGRARAAVATGLVLAALFADAAPALSRTRKHKPAATTVKSGKAPSTAKTGSGTKGGTTKRGGSTNAAATTKRSAPSTAGSATKNVGPAKSLVPAKAAVVATGAGSSVAPIRLQHGDLRVPVENGVTAVLTQDNEIVLEAIPRSGEVLKGFAKRMCGDSRLTPQVVAANGGRSELLTGVRYRLPYELISNVWQLKAVQKLFPGDRTDAEGWRHQVRGVGPLRRESLWHMAVWFTGKGENFRAIREHNSLTDDDLPQGTSVVIPSELLRPAFGPALPVPETPYHLDYGIDKDGEYAIYHLRPGEALYSGVVVRFTGRIYAADVNALAGEIAKRSGIEDVTDIPIGYEVKIPFDVLEPEFLPEGHPKRKEYEASLRASAQFSNQVHTRGLSGITVVIDAGHGGNDSGASPGGVWESLYVYDIALRLKRLLEGQSAAKAVLTTRDGSEFRIQESDVLPASRRHSVMTDPPYPIEDPVIGVNLRWYLTNSVFRHAVRDDHDAQKVVFLSIHADSLHPSLRGTMAYIPAARMRDDNYGKSGPAYALRKEFQESPRVSFPMNQRVESEGLSRELAKQIIAAIQQNGLLVHPFSPVRDRVIRNHSEWVPAVLRYNMVPAKMLLEVCNLANDQDRQLIQTRAYRQKMSEAIFSGLLAYYGQDKNDGAAVTVAKR